MINPTDLTNVVFKEESLQRHLTDVATVDGIFPSWPTILATILAMLVLMIVFTKLLYKPIKKNFENRRKYIQNNIDEAEKSNKDASFDREKANEELINARIEAASIISAAKLEAEEVRVIKIEKARDEAQSLIKNAKENILAEQVKFEEESKKMIIEVALDAAAKVIEKEVDNKTNRKIVENFISTK